MQIGFSPAFTSNSSRISRPNQLNLPKFGNSEDELDLSASKALGVKDTQADLVAEMVMALPENRYDGTSVNLHTILDSVQETDPKQFIRILKSVLQNPAKIPDGALGTMWYVVQHLPTTEYTVEKLNDAPAWQQERGVLMAFLEVSSTYSNLGRMAYEKQTNNPDSQEAKDAKSRFEAFKTANKPLAPIMERYLNSLWLSEGKDLKRFGLSPEADLGTVSFYLEEERRNKFGNDGFSSWLTPEIVSEAETPAFIAEMKSEQLALMKQIYQRTGEDGKAQYFWAEGPWVHQNQGVKDFQEAMILEALTQESAEKTPKLFKRVWSNIAYIQDPEKRMAVFQQFWDKSQPSQIRYDAGCYYSRLEKDPARLMAWIADVLENDPDELACEAAVVNLVVLSNIIHQKGSKDAEIPEEKVMDAFLKKWYNHPKVANNPALRARMIRQSTFENRTEFGIKKLFEWYDVFKQDSSPEVQAAAAYYIWAAFKHSYSSERHQLPSPIRAFEIYEPFLRPDRHELIRETAAHCVKVYLDRSDLSTEEKKQLIQLCQGDTNEKVQEMVKELQNAIDWEAKREERNSP